MRRALVIITVLLASLSAAAQEEIITNLETATEQEEEKNYGKKIIINRFRDNWEISARIGTQAYLGEYILPDYIFKFKDWWTFPAVDISFQKWATHSIGFTIGATNARYKGLRYATGDIKAQFAKKDDPLYSENNNFYVSTGSYSNVYVGAVINLINAIGGFKRDRIYNLVLSVGGGIMFPTSSVSYKSICASFNGGLINQFSISKHLTLDLAVRGTINDDMFNGISYYTSDDHSNISVDGTLGVTAGISYHFNFARSHTRNAKGRKVNEEGWTEVNDVAKYTDTYRDLAGVAAASSTALAAANEKIGDMEKEIARQAQEKAHPDTVTVRESITFITLINFKIDKWNITNREKVSILFAADVIKNHPYQKFLISGFADKQTSTPEHNQMLSEKRAEAVFNCLVNEFGVNPDQLVKIENGGVDYMYFNDKQCSRSVLITEYDPQGKN